MVFYGNVSKSKLDNYVFPNITLVLRKNIEFSFFNFLIDFLHRLLCYESVCVMGWYVFQHLLSLLFCKESCLFSNQYYVNIIDFFICLEFAKVTEAMEFLRKNYEYWNSEADKLVY